jgi:signal transduction histidine kinase
VGYFDLSIQPVPEGLFILSMDISERKKNEQEKELYTKELEQVLFKISHEMRQPIVQILGLSEVIEDSTASNEETEKFLGLMKESALALDKYTRDLSGFVTAIKNKTGSSKAL